MGLRPDTRLMVLTGGVYRVFRDTAIGGIVISWSAR